MQHTCRLRRGLLWFYSGLGAPGAEAGAAARPCAFPPAPQAAADTLAVITLFPDLQLSNLTPPALFKQVWMPHLGPRGVQGLPV